MSLPISVASLVFLDLETTSIPKLENNKTNITEISLIAVKRRHFLDCKHGETPRVQHKLTLCVYPGRIIDPGCTRTTGLSNSLLENESRFDIQVFDTLNNFLSTLEKPICLLAHNGLCHDFPILRATLEKILKRFSDDLLCADTLQAYRDIFNDFEALEEFDKDIEEDILATEAKEKIVKVDLTPNTISEFDEEYSSKNEYGINEDVANAYEKEFEKEFNIENEVNNASDVQFNLTQNTLNEFYKDFSTQRKESTDTKDEIEDLTPNTLLEFSNEVIIKIDNRESEKTLNLISESQTTPIKSTVNIPAAPKKRVRPPETKRQRNAKRRLTFSEKKGMRLCNIYKKLLKKPAVGCHHAENDCIINLEAALAVKEQFVYWVDNNCCVFNDIEPMTIGVRLN